MVFSCEVCMPVDIGVGEARRNRKVCLLAYDNLCVFEYAMALEVFALERQYDPWYTLRIVNAGSDEISGLGDVTIRPGHGVSEFDNADLIIIPGWSSTNTPVSDILKQAIINAHARGCRIASICSGVFVLAQCGLLDGRKATTHWKYVKTLSEQFPDINIDANVLYVDGGDIITSAGSLAGIDMCLHIVRQDFGVDCANEMAKQLVMPPHRQGGQAQFISRPTGYDYKGNIAILLDDIRENLDQDWSIGKMAEQSRTSSRTLQRRIRLLTGLSPHAWLTTERIELVKDLLETTNLNIQKIADITGLKTPETLRHHFKRLTGTSPSQYRANFNPA
ncbi:MAG: AraC family transcriptional regulator [Robiginitomaculum sp.]|nr:MAG: AraC family transcriptional regulator [Robiginitomaculum sp.]